MTIQPGDHYMMINKWHHNDHKRKDHIQQPQNDNDAEKIGQNKREKEKEPFKANDMNESFCVFADSMEKLNHPPVAQKNIHHQVKHDSVFLEFLEAKTIIWNRPIDILKYSKWGHGTRKRENNLIVNIICCVCLCFENTLCIHILLYIPWWYFGGMFIINVTFVKLTLSWGMPRYHKLITNKPQIVPFHILSQNGQIFFKERTVLSKASSELLKLINPQSDRKSRGELVNLFGLWMLLFGVNTQVRNLRVGWSLFLTTSGLYMMIFLCS